MRAVSDIPRIPKTYIRCSYAQVIAEVASPRLGLSWSQFKITHGDKKSLETGCHDILIANYFAICLGMISCGFSVDILKCRLHYKMLASFPTKSPHYLKERLASV